MVAIITLLAQQEPDGTAGVLGGLLPLLLIVAVFWLLLIRPQQKRAKQHRELVQAIGVGDRIVTVGGLHGTVRSVDEETIRVEIAVGTDVTLARSAVARRMVDADSGEGLGG